MLALWIWASTTLALLGAIINLVNSCWVSTVIDRVLANSCWLSTVIVVAVFHLPHIASDHALLLIKVIFEYARKREKKKLSTLSPTGLSALVSPSLFKITGHFRVGWLHG